MGKKKGTVIISIMVMLILAVAIVVVFYLLMQGKLGASSRSSTSSTEVEKLLDKDLDTKYPQTATEVVKLYWRYNKCMYNKSMKDEKLEGLLAQVRKLYDPELLALEENSEENMFSNVKKEVKTYQDEGKTISTYVVQQNSTVERGTIDGKEGVIVISGISTKKKSEREQVYERFLCRQDDNNQWHILGWEKTTDKADIALLGED